MLRPVTDTARKAILETIVHGVVSMGVISSATVLAALGRIDSTSYLTVIGAGIAASGAVSVLQGKVTNGTVGKEVTALAQTPGGRRFTDPPRKPFLQHPESEEGMNDAEQ